MRYIQTSTAGFHAFVANRLAVIYDGSHTSEWRYINTKLNPADHASRGLFVESLFKEEKQIKATNFLLEQEEQWPKEPLLISEKTITENDPEVKRVIVNVVITSSTDLRENTTESVNKLFEHQSLWYLLGSTVKAANRKFINFMSFENITFLYRAFQV